MTDHLTFSGPKLRLDPRRCQLRARPGLELVPLEKLPESRRRLLTGPQPDPELYGVLRPAAGAGKRRQRLVDRETATLLLALGKDGRSRPGADLQVSSKDLVRLILEEILDVETEDGFLSGPRCLHRLLAIDPLVPRNLLARRSHDALRYGERLGPLPVAMLSARLYRFGRLPATPSRRGHRRLLDPVPSRSGGLGFDAGAAVRRQLRRHWRPGDNPPWSVFWPLETPPSAPGRPSKLYISPRPEALTEAFRVVVETLSETGPRPLKVARRAADFLRPDKLLVYLPTWGAARELAEVLAPRLAHLPAHGVPFTAAFDPSGLLSWGPEPCRRAQTLPWLQAESWRLWLTNRFALALEAARRAALEGAEAWRYAAARLHLEGVDPETFLPDDDLWQVTPDQGDP